MNNVRFAYFLEQFLQEERTDVRPRGYINYDHPDYEKKGAGWTPSPRMAKLADRDSKKLFLKGIIDKEKKLTTKGKVHAASSINRKFKADIATGHVKRRSHNDF